MLDGLAKFRNWGIMYQASKTLHDLYWDNIPLFSRPLFFFQSFVLGSLNMMHCNGA